MNSKLKRPQDVIAPRCQWWFQIYQHLGEDGWCETGMYWKRRKHALRWVHSLPPKHWKLYRIRREFISDEDKAEIRDCI